MLSSDFNDAGDSSDNFSPEPKPASKAKVISKKSSAPSTKAKAAPKKSTQSTLKVTKNNAPKKRTAPASDEENSDDDSAGDDSLLSNTPPSAKRQKKGPAPKRTGSKPLREIDNESLALDGADHLPAASKGKKEQYQKVRQSF